MRSANVYFRRDLAGVVTEFDDGRYGYTYDEAYLATAASPPVSLTLPKRSEPYESQTFFPFLYQLLPEGTNKRILCELQRVDPEDYFSILLLVAKADTVGAITVQALDHD